MSDDDSFGSDLEPSSEDFDDGNESDDFEDDAPKKKAAKATKAPAKTAKTTKGKTTVAVTTKESIATTIKKTPTKSSGARIVTTPVTQSALLQHARVCGQSRSSHLPPLHRVKA
ncbi:hypothetical protein GPJ56_001665 [Histomonas meleagridis]|uniref:uncharacterized protein n=1 Tax=Histomonas meleagridis TaxID=135588 RepID=UPI00355A4C30|nr:hypothetical protein GPJ56_001665 [Histomonas meleagridis]KAH0796249.1 hypothetical protein GO595_010142 [Histomonas meleagridis]